ncbi:energy-coupling factor transporter transmembrane component T family protein [Gemmobacter serpentinus]|uniref:energy-coupling factor transporter transmembrane component T family protein n=1 Tax=Gemmobacter serpentinus TaxID=2652247 RepID=UPI00124D740F|nr:energy-coupling factor transporter transmembrane protein EcfT [Gemmobacter serpentinus]
MLTLTSPVETWLHRWPAGVKLAMVALGTVLIFAIKDPWIMGLVVAALMLAYLAQGARFAAQGLRLLHPLWPFFLILALWHLWLAEPRQGLLLAGRMLSAVALANLVTMTTRLDAMLAVLERLLAPLVHLGLRPRVLALAMALVIRFVPVLLDKAGQLRQAWRARSPRRVGAQIVLPLALAALDDADHVAEALRARGGL